MEGRGWVGAGGGESAVTPTWLCSRACSDFARETHEASKTRPYLEDHNALRSAVLGESWKRRCEDFFTMPVYFQRPENALKRANGKK